MSLRVPVLHSLLEAEALGPIISQEYSVGAVTEVRLLAPGLNDTYLVQARHRRFILRVYRAGWRSWTDVIYELDALDRLHARGAPVAFPLRTTHGDKVMHLDTPEGERHAALFSYASGVTVDLDDPALCRQFGRDVATLHQAGADFARDFDRDHTELETMMSLRFIRPILEERRAEWDYLLGLTERLTERLAPLAARPLALCHGDLHPENAHYDGASFTFFDFDNYLIWWPVYDLATVRWSLNGYGRRLDPSHDARWAAFLTAYEGQRPLGDTERTAIVDLVMVRQLWMLGLHARLAPVFGYGRFTDAYCTGVIGFLQEWEARYRNVTDW